jgi:hypothetical protein
LTQEALADRANVSRDLVAKPSRARASLASEAMRAVRRRPCSSVMIHRVSAAVALGDPLGALATAQRIDIAAMPAVLCGHQAQVHLDSAWAYAQLREDALAVIHLLDVERVAPDLMVVSPEARGLIRDLLLRERRGAMPGLRGLALRAGVAA